VHTLLADDRGNLSAGAADTELQSKSTASPT